MRDSAKARKIHAEAIKNFDKIQEDQYEVREQCLEDRRFYSLEGGQWEGALEEQFENKPRYEMNKIHLSVIRIFNEFRNNRVTVDFISKDGTDNDKMADVCDGLFRADERDSGAEEAYDNAFEEAVGGGIGAFRLCAEYEDEGDEENEKQRIRIEPIYDADASVFFDPDAKRQDKADARYAYVMHSMSREAYEEEYNQDAASLDKNISQAEYDWAPGDFIYVAEYYVVEREKKTVYVYENITGQEEKYTEEDFEENPELERELAAIGTKLVRQRKVSKKRVRKYLMDGARILEGGEYIAGENIPVIPVYGKRWFVDSIERCMGHVRLAKDTQRLKNMLMSKLAEISSLSSVEKPIFTPEQMAGHTVMWSEDNIKNYPYMLVNPLTDKEGNPQAAGPIAYTKPPAIPQALSALMGLVDMDMKELLGNNMEADKILSHVSGKAQEMVQKRIDGQAFIYMDNFSKAIRRAGEVWLSMAKDVYVEKGRKMKTVDASGQMGSVELLQPGISDSGEVTEKNDLTKATFDVAVDVGPSSASQREATVKTIMGMMQLVQDPETQQVLQAMALMNMEGDGISDAREFFRKKLVQMGVVKPTEEEAKQMAEAAANAEPTPQEQYLMAEAAKAQAGAKKANAEVFETIAQTEKIKAETLNTYDEIDLKKLQEVRSYLDQLAQLQQQREQAQMQRQAQLVQASQGQNMPSGGQNNPMGTPNAQ